MVNEYTDEQIGMLIGLMPELMAALNQIASVPAVTLSDDRLAQANRTIKAMRTLAMEILDRLDRYCWHIPTCAQGERCVGGEQPVAGRLP